MSKKVLCIDTGELFCTISAAAKTVMGTGSNLWKAIKAGIPYHDKKFVYVEEEKPETKTQCYGAAKEKAVIDMNTGKVYSSAAEMGRKLGIPRTSISEAMRFSRQIKGHLPVHYDSLTPIEQKKIRKLSKLTNKLTVRCVENRRKYESIAECARKLDCPVYFIRGAELIFTKVYLLYAVAYPSVASISTVLVVFILKEANNSSLTINDNALSLTGFFNDLITLPFNFSVTVNSSVVSASFTE